MAPSARDRRSLLALVEKAQLVYLLTRCPKRQVLDDPKDVARLEEGLADMPAAAILPALEGEPEPDAGAGTWVAY